MSEKADEPPSWAHIDARLALPGGAEAFARREIIPLLEQAPAAARTRKGQAVNRMELPMSVGFFSFVGLFIALNVLLPDNALGVAVRVVLFPVLFFGCIVGSVYAFRDRLVETVSAGGRRFALRAAAIARLAQAAGLVHTPAPGGASPALRRLAQIGWLPPALREAAALADQHGGMDDALRTAKASGALGDDTAFAGNARQKADFHAQIADAADVEDGFSGVRGGVAFEAFEWKQSRGESDAAHHLVMTFAAPRPFHGVIQLRTRGAEWPANPAQATLAPVGVVAPQFEERFQLRASDQVEARAVFDPVVLERVARLARGKRARAVANDRALVVTVEGADRFALIDIVSGEWSEAAIRRTMADIADLLDLADAVAHAFRLPATTNESRQRAPAAQGAYR